MIRNVVIHVTNEQPLLADLFGLPTASDVGLLCTNVRMLDGKRPIFIDDSSATFFFPYLVIRFVEIPVGASSRPAPDDLPAENRDIEDRDIESRLPVPVAAGADGEGDGELEIDEDFLRRVRDI